jgi:hypothetical protein
MNSSPVCHNCSSAAFFTKPAAAQSKEAASSTKIIISPGVSRSLTSFKDLFNL